MELGCGPGTYTLDIARAVRDRGEVYAVDIQKAMIDKLEKKLQKPENRDVRNVIPKVANAYELPLPEDCLDTVIVICALQEIPDRQRALGEVHRVLRPHGVLAVSEWAVDPDYPLRRTTKRICEQAGFRLKESGGNLFHYTFQFEKQSDDSLSTQTVWILLGAVPRSHGANTVSVFAGITTPPTGLPPFASKNSDPDS
jgi:ubiquinone/menaquinone biosynthesis C-methylase UbiE